MKKISIVGLFLLSVVTVFNSCRKDDNPKIPDLTRFPTPLVQKVAGTDQTISATNPASFTGKVTVDFFFEGNITAPRFDVVVIKNGNKANVKVLQSNVTTFPSTITVTGAQLTTLFGGTPIVLGDRFDIGVDITTNEGVKYEAFPAVGAAYGSGIASQPGASTSVRYEAVCKYDPAIYQGNFVVVTDEWADYGVGDVVPVTMIDATHFSFKYLAAGALPIIVAVNANDNSVSVAKQVYGSGYPPNWPYGNISAATITSTENFVAPCDKTFSVVLNHTAGVDFGNYKIVLRKQ